MPTIGPGLYRLGGGIGSRATRKRKEDEAKRKEEEARMLARAKYEAVAAGVSTVEAEAGAHGGLTSEEMISRQKKREADLAEADMRARENAEIFLGSTGALKGVPPGQHQATAEAYTAEKPDQRLGMMSNLNKLAKDFAENAQKKTALQTRLGEPDVNLTPGQSAMVTAGSITPEQANLTPRTPQQPPQASYDRSMRQQEARRRGLQPGTPGYFDFVMKEPDEKTGALTAAQTLSNALEQVRLNSNLIWDQKQGEETAKVIEELGYSNKDYQEDDKVRKVVGEVVNARRLGFLDANEARARSAAGDNDGSLEALDRALDAIVTELEAQLQALKGRGGRVAEEYRVR